jgi:hypothetical protein
MLDAPEVAGGALDAWPKKSQMRWNVAAKGVDLVQDAVLAQGLGRMRLSSPVEPGLIEIAS